MYLGPYWWRLKDKVVELLRTKYERERLLGMRRLPIFLYCQSADRGCTSFSRSIEIIRTQNHVYSINIQRCWYHIDH